MTSRRDVPAGRAGAPEEGLLSIAELVSRTGVPVATIHHYRRLGLLPPAREVSGRRLRYDERHVKAVLLVRRLRQRRLALDAIAAILPDLMAAGEEEAFRPGIWDEALAARGAADSAGARLITAATQQFIRQGYGAVSVNDVSDAAGLAKGTVYRHFASKERLFVAVVDAAVTDVLARFDRKLPGRARIDPPAAARLLGQALEPYAPLAVDLVAGALRRQPELAGAAAAAIGRIVAHVGACVRGRGDDEELGRAVMARALNQSVAGLLGSGARAD